MIKQYLKQAWFIIKGNPLVSTISIIGTALSIAMIMVVVMIYQIQIAGYAPEYHRDRMLYIDGVRAQSIDKNNRHGTAFSSQAVKEVIYSLKQPEAITAYGEGTRPVSLPGRRLYKGYDIKYTDPGFWEVFNFQFLKGIPFTEADFQSGIPRAVITDQLARKLWGTEDVIGQTLLLDYDEFSVCGVVKEVSKAARDAYAQVWVPYTTNSDLMSLRHCEEIGGNLYVVILAKSPRDFPFIKEEINRQTDRYNESKSEYNLTYDHEPLDRLDKAVGSSSFMKKDMKEIITQVGALFLFLLIIPALNLTGVNQASVQQRKSEIGVRKSFGATFHVLVWQILTENLFTTLIGGGVGFILSFLFLLWGKDFLLNSDPILTTEMLFQPSLFIGALLFILLLNILSAFLPAWRIARQPIIDALNENN